MSKVMFLVLTLVLSNQAFAKKSCTDRPRGEWKTKEEFAELIKSKGYKFTEVETSGSCYEIYGTNPEGQDMEIYFNPVNGDIVKSKKIRK